MAESDSVAKVCAAYGVTLDVLAEYDCQPLRARIVKDTLKVRTPVGTRALKRVQMTDEDLGRAFACAEHVAANGLYRVPRFIRTIYGDSYVAHESGLYYLTTWLPGRQPNLRRPGELFECVRLLGQWHRCAAGLQFPRQRSVVPEPLIAVVQGAAPEVQGFRAHVTQATRHGAFDKLFLACADELEERIAFALEELEVVSTDQMGAEVNDQGFVCHGNFRRSTVLFDGEAWAVRNYEHVHFGHPLHELALFLHRTLPAFTWDVEILSEAVAAYESGFGSLHAQREWLAALLSVPARPLQIVSWYYRQAQPWDEEDYVDALEAALEVEEAREAARMTWLERANDPVSSVTTKHVVPASTQAAASARTLQDVQEQRSVQEDWASAVHRGHRATPELAGALDDEVRHKDDEPDAARGRVQSRSAGKDADVADGEKETLVIRDPQLHSRQRRARLTMARAKGSPPNTRRPERAGPRLWGDAAPPLPD